MRHLALAVIAAVMAACASVPIAAETRHADPADAANRFANLLQSGVRYDYDPFDTPSDQRDAADLVVVGTIAEVVPGRQLPLGRAATHANLVIAVQEIIRGSKPDVKTVYVEVELGSGIPVADVRDAAPVGQRLILFLDDRTDIKGLDGETGRPSGASIYAPFVQGMIVEAGTDWVSALVDRSELSSDWRSITSFEAFVSSLRS